MANGVEGDLRTGLTQQMIEIHEPARLLIVIEQSPEIIDMAMSRLADLKDWPENEWVRMAACLPGSRDLFLYNRRGWEKIDLPDELEIPVAEQSANAYMGQDKTIPVHYLTGRH